jgi:ATPase subunit of ABC transporter with duplicated ATPase domains
VMGINGAGKSTLLKLVTGSTEPDEGTVALGGSVKMGYFAQHAMELLDGDRPVFQSLEETRSRRPGRARCARSPAASASPATMSRSAAACCRAARRRGW